MIQPTVVLRHTGLSSACQPTRKKGECADPNALTIPSVPHNLHRDAAEELLSSCLWIGHGSGEEYRAGAGAPD